MAKKIIVDLDIVTMALWNKKGEDTQLARRFINRVEEGEFDVVTPFVMLELLTRWKYSALVENIQQFYLKNTKVFITNEDIDKKLDLLNVDDKKVLSALKAAGVKGEDALLALITSIFEIDCLVTFNRKHLKSKRERINGVLTENGVKTVRIIGPEDA